MTYKKLSNLRKVWSLIKCLNQSYKGKSRSYSLISFAWWGFSFQGSFATFMVPLLIPLNTS